MTRMVLLDAGPLGMATHPRKGDDVKLWLADLLSHGVDVVVPEIADYEVRRELIRAKATRGIANLDAIASRCNYVALTTEIMRRAARLWAQMRDAGTPTAIDAALDGDVILCAVAQLLAEDGHAVTVATTNVGHLSRMADAKLWSAIAP